MNLKGRMEGYTSEGLERGKGRGEIKLYFN